MLCCVVVCFVLGGGGVCVCVCGGGGGGEGGRKTLEVLFLS